jgi:anti-sigma factor RsiW
MSSRLNLHEHVAEEDLALYVMGALEGDRSAAVEAHVMACGACAEGLAREARLEGAFDEVVRRGADHADVRALRAPVLAMNAAMRASRLRSRFMGGVAGALVAAAAVVLLFAETSLADQGASASQVHAGAYDGAAGDMSGALIGEVRSEKLDGG